MRVTVEAPAKINLTLDVLGREPNGYHRLESIMQAVDRYDRLVLTPAADITLTVTGGEPCPMEKNTAYRAAVEFFRFTGVSGGVAMTLEKTIPQQAGMGGGSADAAAALIGLNTLYGTELSRETLTEIGMRVGADVPFCVVGGTAMVTGFGENIEPLPSMPDAYIVVAQPDAGVSTAAAYAALDAFSVTERPDHTAAREALRSGDLAALCGQAVNVFEPATAIEEVGVLRARMERFSPLVSRMTGSGSAVFGIFTDSAAAGACLADLLPDHPGAFLCRPCGGCRVQTEE